MLNGKKQRSLNASLREGWMYLLAWKGRAMSFRSDFSGSQSRKSKGLNMEKKGASDKEGSLWAQVSGCPRRTVNPSLWTVTFLPAVTSPILRSCDSNWSRRGSVRFWSAQDRSVWRWVKLSRILLLFCFLNKDQVFPLQKWGLGEVILQATWRPSRWDIPEVGSALRGSEIKEGASDCVTGL